MEAAKADRFEKTMLPDYAANLTRCLTRNEHEARDAVHGAYLRALRFFNGSRGRDGRSWLLAVVRNTALTWLYREKTVPRVSFDEIHGPGSGAATVDAKLVEGVKFAALRNCLDLLRVQFHEIVVMREMEDRVAARMKEASK